MAFSAGSEVWLGPCLYGRQMLGALIEAHAKRSPETVALLAPGRSPCTYGRLARHVAEAGAALNRLGVGRGARVALVLPDGAEMAAALVAVMAVATAAPLNPTYRAREFEALLGDLAAAAVIVPAGEPSAAIGAARALGIRVIELSAAGDGPAGLFTLAGEARLPVAPGAASIGSEVALLLPTSGTTSRPKLVPLTHDNVRVSATTIGATLGLSSADRVLGVMPLSHIHGMVGALLSSLAAGASVVCPPSFAIDRFFDWMAEFRPTWFTAVPTIHQAIVAEAPGHGDAIAGCPLRFIRSCSAPLPPRVLADLEALFGVPVIEAYGMTEAAHQVASNPLPPRERKRGSVGVATGPEVAVVDGDGRRLGADAVGEVVVRGANVMRGYLAAAGVPAALTDDGWFRTGDRGYLDRDGYLFLTGRIKELINRGGEKIAPVEVDTVLGEHPAVAQAVAFAVPHPSLGEEVAAAIVVRPGASVAAPELRAFAAARLAPFKVPRRIVIVDRVPKGPSGKVQRIGLAEKLAAAGLLIDNVRAAGALLHGRQTAEHQLIEIWERLLEVHPIGVRDDFFDLGGYSLLALRLIAEIERVFGRRLPVDTLNTAATVEQLARILLLEEQAAASSPLIEIQRQGSRPPFFFLHGDLDGGGFYCRGLSRALGPSQPFYALRPHGTYGNGVPATIEGMASGYLPVVRSVQPRGPYLLGGFCNGALVAFELARELRRQGEPVPFVALVAPPTPSSVLNFVAFAIIDRLVSTAARWTGAEPDERVRRFVWWRNQASDLKAFGRRALGRSLDGQAPKGAAEPSMALSEKVNEAYRLAVTAHVPRKYDGAVTIFWPSEHDLRRPRDATIGWRHVCRQARLQVVPGEHLTCLTRHLSTLAERLGTCLEEAWP